MQCQSIIHIRLFAIYQARAGVRRLIYCIHAVKNVRRATTFKYEKESVEIRADTRHHTCRVQPLGFATTRVKLQVWSNPPTLIHLALGGDAS